MLSLIVFLVGKHCNRLLISAVSALAICIKVMNNVDVVEVNRNTASFANIHTLVEHVRFLIANGILIKNRKSGNVRLKYEIAAYIYNKILYNRTI